MSALDLCSELIPASGDDYQERTHMDMHNAKTSHTPSQLLMKNTWLTEMGDGVSHDWRNRPGRCDITERGYANW